MRLETTQLVCGSTNNGMLHTDSRDNLKILVNIILQVPAGCESVLVYDDIYFQHAH